MNGTGKGTEKRRAIMKREGKIILNLAKASDLDQGAIYGIILELEQYLNNEVALECCQKFGIGLRFHLSA